MSNPETFEPMPIDPVEMRKARAIKREKVGRWLLPLIVVVLSIFGWDRMVVINEIPHYIIPRPGRVLQALIEDWSLLIGSLGTTLTITFSALAIAIIGGVGIAVLFAQSKWIEMSFFPYAVILQVTPIIVIAPLIFIYVDSKFAGLLIDKRYAPFYSKFGAYFPKDKYAVFSMVGPKTIAAFTADAKANGGSVSLMMNDAELAAAKLPPAYEYGWNHTTLQALKSDRSYTNLQVAYPQPYDPEIDRIFMEEFEDVIMHHEFAKERGDYQLFSLPLFKFTTTQRLYKIAGRFEELGCGIFDAHVYTIAEGGMKVVDQVQVDFKALADPHGLMNPGKINQEDSANVLAQYGVELPAPPA